MRLKRRFVVAASAVFAVMCCGVLTPTFATDPSAAADTDPTQWRQVALNYALDLAADVEDPYRRAEVLASIARAQVSVAGSSAADKAIHQALDAAAHIETPEFRGWVLNDIVLAQIAAEDLIGAKQTAETITAARPQSSAFGAIAGIQIRSGALPAAQALVPRIRDKEVRSEVSRQIVAALSADGDIEAATKMLPDITDPYYSTVAHGDVAVAHVDKGDIAGANAVAAGARRVSRNEVYGRIALARAATGDVAGARQSLRKIDDPLQRATAQGRVALQRIDQGDDATARELLSPAIDAVQASKAKPDLKLLPTAQLARWQALAGDRKAASETLRRTRREAEQLPPGTARDDLLDYIARSQARAGDVRDAIDAAKNINDRVSRALLVRDAVSLQPDATSASAAAWAKEFADPLVDTAAQFGVLSLQSFRTGQPLSLDTIDAARVAVRKINDRELKPAAFAALAAARVKAGDLAGSREIFHEALASAESLPRSEHRAAACVRIVNALNDRLMFLGRPAGEKGEDT